MSQTKFAAIGECMVELSHQSGSVLRLDFAGDSYNVALYLARYQLQLSSDVFYLTALGDDPYSSQMLERFQAEGINTTLIPQLEGQQPGLYLICTDKQGERDFIYYRSQSAAKQFCRCDFFNKVAQALESFNYLFFSGITLAILDETSRDKLWHVLMSAKKQGAKIIFDNNYRPILWSSIDETKQVYEKFISITDIALPTFADEQAIYNDKTVDECISRYQSLDVKEIIVKCGNKPCVVVTPECREEVTACSVEKVIDTTAAGDSFSAGYIAGRIHGLNPVSSAKLGHKLAATVIQHPGAIIPVNEMPELF